MKGFYLVCLALVAAFLALALLGDGVPAVGGLLQRLPDELPGFVRSVGWGLRSSADWLMRLFRGNGSGLPPCPAAMYLALMNAVALVAMGVDKVKALVKAWRMPERTLFILAILGGSFGAWTGMYLFHHKTNAERKPHFVFGFPAIFVTHVALGYLAWRYLR